MNKRIWIEKRNTELDIVKGLAIIVVVSIHAQMPILKWLQLIQMQVFFIASGFCYNPKASESIENMKIYIMKRLKALYVPCFLWSLTVTLLHNEMVKISLIAGEIYSIKQMLMQIGKCVLFSGGGQLSGTIWFLRTMFGASTLYMLLDQVSRNVTSRRLYRSIMCVVCLLLGWLAEVFSIPGQQYFNVFSVVFLYEIGRTIRDYKPRYLTPGSDKRESALSTVIIVFCSIIFLYILKQVGGIAVNSNAIINPIVFAASSILGWILFVQLSFLMNRVKITVLVLSYLGKHTLPIMLFHFLSFKIITVLQLLLYQFDWEQLTSFPCLIIDNSWWIVYTICGVCMPLIFYEIYTFVKRKILKGPAKVRAAKSE